jgi:hypothetical protein
VDQGGLLCGGRFVSGAVVAVVEADDGTSAARELLELARPTRRRGVV